jgi:glycosyltransferase involved in cell wall biosynthesis
MLPVVYLPTMRVLVITSRFPWPSYTGERLRASIWISALARSGEVALVAPRGSVPEGLPRFRFFTAQRSLRRLAVGTLRLLRDGLPLQCLMAAPYDWREAIDRAGREAGPFDVSVVILSRMHPWVEDSLQGRTVLDAVDSLRRSAAERAKASGPLMRWLWRVEERRMGRLERAASLRYGKVVVVSEDEREEFGEAVAVPIGITTRPLENAPRAYDFGFWGRFPYFANADAAAWLLDEIWPAIRALQPSATLIMGGADAPRPLRNAARDRGVTLVSPVDDIGVFARGIRVALMPLRFGSGQSNKTLEAAEAGCAIVGTPLAFRGLAPLAGHARIESSTDGFARAAVDLLLDHALRARQVEQLREVVAAEYARAVTLDRLAAIAGATTEVR